MEDKQPGVAPKLWNILTFLSSCWHLFGNLYPTEHSAVFQQKPCVLWSCECPRLISNSYLVGWIFSSVRIAAYVEPCPGVMEKTLLTLTPQMNSWFLSKIWVHPSALCHKTVPKNFSGDLRKTFDWSVWFSASCYGVTNSPLQQREIWPQRPMYFAATIAIHHSAARGVAWWHIPGGGLTLVLTWLKAGGGGGGSAKPKVLLLAKPLELQNYIAPFSKAAK